MSEPMKGIQKRRSSSTNIQTIADAMLPRLTGGFIVDVATGTP